MRLLSLLLVFLIVAVTSVTVQCADHTFRIVHASTAQSYNFNISGQAQLVSNPPLTASVGDKITFQIEFADSGNPFSIFAGSSSVDLIGSWGATTTDCTKLVGAYAWYSTNINTPCVLTWTVPQLSQAQLQQIITYRCYYHDTMTNTITIKSVPTTAVPTAATATKIPTAAPPSTAAPTTAAPSTATPTTATPSTSAPTTIAPTPSGLNSITSSITLSEARAVVDASLHHGWSLGARMSISVVDITGAIKLRAIADGTVGLAIQLTDRKAHTILLNNGQRPGTLGGSFHNETTMGSRYHLENSNGGLISLDGATLLQRTNSDGTQVSVGAVAGGGFQRPSDDQITCDLAAQAMNNPLQQLTLNTINGGINGTFTRSTYEDIITLQQALSICEAAVAQATTNQVGISCAVVGNSGSIKVLYRMDGVAGLYADSSLRQARAARFFENSTSNLLSSGRYDGSTFMLDDISPYLSGNQGLSFIVGGVPILGVDGQVIGAVGITGSGDIHLDESIARYAIDHVSPVITQTRRSSLNQYQIISLLNAGLRTAAVNHSLEHFLFHIIDAGGQVRATFKQDGFQSASLTEVAAAKAFTSFLFRANSEFIGGLMLPSGSLAGVEFSYPNDGSTFSVTQGAIALYDQLGQFRGVIACVGSTIARNDTQVCQYAASQVNFLDTDNRILNDVNGLTYVPPAVGADRMLSTSQALISLSRVLSGVTVPSAISIIDASGDPRIHIIQDNALPGCMLASYRKARNAAVFGLPNGFLTPSFSPSLGNSGLYGLQRALHSLPQPGGVPIYDTVSGSPFQGHVIGSIGVCGDILNLGGKLAWSDVTAAYLGAGASDPYDATNPLNPVRVPGCVDTFYGGIHFCIASLSANLNSATISPTVDLPNSTSAAPTHSLIITLLLVTIITWFNCYVQ